jgi:hypothetical protein
MSQCDLDEVMQCISEPRLVGVRGNNLSPSELLDYYVLAIKRNQTLYPAFHILEVILRNKLHSAIGEIFEMKEWLLEYSDPKNPLFMKKIFALKKDFKEDFDKQIKSSYNEAIKKIGEKNRTIIEGDLISGLTFGFWTTFLGRPFSNILGDKGLFVKVFSDFKFGKIGTKEFTREESEIRYKINEIRKERNRAFHHEKIHHFEKTKNLLWETIRFISNDTYIYFYNIFNKN